MPRRFGTELLRVVRDLDRVSRYAYRTFFHPDPRAVGYYLFVHLEQEPNPASRITLSERRDALGVPLGRLDWRLGDLERRSFRRALELVAQEFGRIGLGRVREIGTDLPRVSWLQKKGAPGEGGWPPGLRGSYHHIGTTRMASDPRRGVVDANCRVHGLTNLFVAGSSVFPTSGCHNPTLTIVALALRLANHLKSRLG